MVTSGISGWTETGWEVGEGTRLAAWKPANQSQRGSLLVFLSKIHLKSTLREGHPPSPALHKRFCSVLGSGHFQANSSNLAPGSWEWKLSFIGAALYLWSNSEAIANWSQSGRGYSENKTLKIRHCGEGGWESGWASGWMGRQVTRDAQSRIWCFHISSIQTTLSRSCVRFFLSLQ